MRFAERLKKVVRDNFVDIAPSPGEETTASKADFNEADSPVAETLFVLRKMTQNEPENAGDGSSLPTEASPKAGTLQIVVADTESGEDEIVSESGEVNFERLFAAAAPHRFTTAQASELIAKLPQDLPLRVKRLTVKTDIEGLAKNQGVPPSDAMQSIVADAAQKMLCVARLQEDIAAQTAAQKAEADEAGTRSRAKNESYLAVFRASKEAEANSVCQQAKSQAAELREAQIVLTTQIAEIQAQIAEKARFIEEITAQSRAIVASETDDKARLLQSETDAQTARCQKAEKRSEAVRRACREQMNVLNDIVLFFDEATMASSPVVSPEKDADENMAQESEELPAFLREDTALKLLGIPKASPVHN